MPNFIARWFTPSDSDNSGMVGPKAPAQAKVSPALIGVAKAKKKTQSKFAGAASELNMFTDEAALAKKNLLGQ
jgi:hypothetical protein